jgi:FlaA1/EpsC-like NDP-sugar epimerase
MSVASGSIILAALTFLVRLNNPDSDLMIPYSVIVIQFALLSNILLASRVWTKSIYNEWFVKSKNIKRVMIYGAGKMGLVTRNALMMDNYGKVIIVGFIDDNKTLHNKYAAGIPIYSFKTAFEKIVPRNNIEEIIIAINNSGSLTKLKREVVDRCLPLKIMVKEVPPVNNWINGTLKANEIKKIKIGDLLGRDAIQLHRQKITEGLNNAVILVAGAAGSIGSEIVRQLLLFKAGHVVLLDKAESDLYDLQQEIISRYISPNYTVIVGDVTNPVNLRRVFEKYRPEIVINAAAYKHVPLMEEFPNEAIRVNIGGTRNLADLSVEFGVKKFVFISTDKAVNPSNVMGATKRAAEIYVQSLVQTKKVTTQFITTRFGNVLGSNGSVVPLFKKQIENGGPVTVTHKDITRYFMTIPEACQLVLEASFMGRGGEIFVFDMGDPIRIYDLAKKMIFLSGFVPEEEIKIKVTGLRPGEKLYEELLQNDENLLPTYNNKIMIGKVTEHDYTLVNSQITHLLRLADTVSRHQLVAFIKGIVPEYTPMNSPYNGSSIVDLTGLKKIRKITIKDKITN